MGHHRPPESLTGSLDDICSKAEGFEPPVVAVVGEVAALHHRLHWFDASRRAADHLRLNPRRTEHGNPHW